jgi:hypothetical protein
MLPSGFDIHIGPPSTGPSSRSFSVFLYGVSLFRVRVHVRAVVALAVVVEEELPVGLDLVDRLVDRLQLLDPPVLELALERRQRLRERHRFGGETHEQEAPPLGEGRRLEAVVRLLEARNVLHVRRRLERAVEAVGPGVVRALQAALHLAVRLGAQAGAAMAAEVVVGVDLPGGVADHHDALAVDLEEEVAAGSGSCETCPASSQWRPKIRSRSWAKISAEVKYSPARVCCRTMFAAS